MQPVPSCAMPDRPSLEGFLRLRGADRRLARLTRPSANSGSVRFEPIPGNAHTLCQSV